MFRAYNHASKTVCGFAVTRHPLEKPLIFWPVFILRFIWGTLTFPSYIKKLISYYSLGGKTTQKYLVGCFGLYIRDLSLTVLLLVLVNYLRVIGDF